LNTSTSNGKTPLVLACECHKHHSLETISYLLNHPKYDICHDEYNGWTPLHIACSHGASYDIVNLLIKAYPEACFKTTITSGQTPLKLGFDPDAVYFYEWERHATLHSLLDPYFVIYDHDGLRTPQSEEEKEQGSNMEQVGIIHLVLSFPYIFPELLDYALERFPSDVCKV
jgi:FOG: Ankyrin repeat